MRIGRIVTQRVWNQGDHTLMLTADRQRPTRL